MKVGWGSYEEKEASMEGDLRRTVRPDRLVRMPGHVFFWLQEQIQFKLPGAGHERYKMEVNHHILEFRQTRRACRGHEEGGLKMWEGP